MWGGLLGEREIYYAGDFRVGNSIELCFSAKKKPPQEKAISTHLKIKFHVTKRWEKICSKHGHPFHLSTTLLRYYPPN